MTGENYEAVVLAGSGQPGKVDGKPDECSFHKPCGIVVHETSHSCFVIDRCNHMIIKVTFVN